MCARKWCLALGLVLSPVMVQAAALEGLQDVRVLVEDEGLRHDGLSKATLKADVELRLRHHGIEVTDDGSRILYLKVMSVGFSEATPHHAFSVNLTLRERVVLVRHAYAAARAYLKERFGVDAKTSGGSMALDEFPDVLAAIVADHEFVPVWEASDAIGVASASKLRSNVRETVRDRVDEFINAYLEANP